MYLILALIALFYLALAIPGSYMAFRVVQTALNSKPLFRWVFFLVICLAWNLAAIMWANELLARSNSAGRSKPAVGADWPALFGVWFFHIPLWFIVFAPSFVAFVAVIIKTPLDLYEIDEQMNRYREFIDDWTSGPKRVYGWGLVLIALAGLARLLIWGFLHY